MSESTAVKSIIGAEDINFATGGTGAAETFTRLTSTGSTLTLSKVDLSHLKFRSFAGSAEDLLDGGYDITLKVADIITKSPVTDARAFSTIALADAAAVAAGQPLLVSSAWAVSANTTLSAPAIIAISGSDFQIATGVTLTISGKVEAGDYQIFTLTGTGAVAGLTISNAAWFGAVGDGATDNAAAFVAAAAAMTTYGTFYIPPAAATYQFSTGFSLKKSNSKVRIDGRLEYTGDSGAAVTFGPGAATGYNEYIDATIAGLVRSSQDWTDTVTGVRFDGTRSCRVDIREVGKFTVNVQLYSSSNNNNYHNEISIGYSHNAKRHLSFDGGEGRMNANVFIGPHCRDDNLSDSYADTYGIYMPRATNSQTNGCKFYSPMFDWTASGKITNDIYIGGEYNSIISPRLIDGSPSDVAIRFHASASNNYVMLDYGAEGIVYDPNRGNFVFATDYHTANKIRWSHKSAYNSNYMSYRPGDRWMNNGFDSQDDSPGKICLTSGSYYPVIAGTATTELSSATVTMSSVSGIYVGMFISIAGVTGPLEVTAKDAVAVTITVSPVADAAVSDAAVSVTAPTFADETPCSLRGYKQAWDPASIADGDSATTTLTVTGAALGDQVIVGFTSDITGLIPFAYVSATNTVTIGLANTTGSPVDLAAISYSYVRVFKY